MVSDDSVGLSSHPSGQRRPPGRRVGVQVAVAVPVVPLLKEEYAHLHSRKEHTELALGWF